MIRSFFKVVQPVRRYLVSNISSSGNEIPQIPQLTFSQVKKQLDKHKGSTMLIDVREGDELITDGKIKESHHLPLGEVESALQLDSGSFKKLYGFDKPLPTDDMNLIIHCKAGVRAMKAAVYFTKEGYSNVKVYNGIMDWLSNGGEVVK